MYGGCWSMLNELDEDNPEGKAMVKFKLFNYKHMCKYKMYIRRLLFRGIPIQQLNQGRISLLCT